MIAATPEKKIGNRSPKIRWRVEPADSLSRELAGELRTLWREDSNRSPFAAPAFLQSMAAVVASDGGRPCWVLGEDDGGRIAALWSLVVDRNGVLRFLQESQGDHCACLCRPGVPIAELSAGLAQAIDELRPASLLLANIPPWGPTLEAAKTAMSLKGWCARAFPATPCPVLAANVAGALAQEFNRHKRIKNYENRLKKQDGFAFEVLTDDSDLQGWTDDFCDAHEWHWDRTDTPSVYASAEARRRWLDFLRAWVEEEQLIRFAIRLGDRRVALVAALRQEDRLVYYHVATSPAAEEFRAGHVMIRLIILWMADAGYDVLDFGIGGEDYKHRYANRDETLWRLHAAPSRFSPAILRGSTEERIRRSPRLQVAWDRWVNRGLRGTALHGLRRFKTRLRMLRRRHLKLSFGELWGLVKVKLIREDEIFFIADAAQGPPDPEVIELKTFEVVTLFEEECDLQPASRARLFALRAEGARPFGFVEAGRVVHVSWIKPAPPHLVPDWIKTDARRFWSIEACLTARDHRGRGLLPRTLTALLKRLPPGDQAILYVNNWNLVSQRGFEKAGFVPLAIRRRRAGSNQAVFERLKAP